MVSILVFWCLLVPAGACCRLTSCTTVNEKGCGMQMLHRRLLHGDVGVWRLVFVSFVDWHRVLQRECGVHRHRFGYMVVVFFSCLFLSVGVCCRLAACTKKGCGMQRVHRRLLGASGRRAKAASSSCCCCCYCTIPPHHHHCPVIAPVLAFSEPLVFPVILSLRLFTCHVF